MRSLLIGYGKMGHYIYDTLAKKDDIAEIVVCDPSFSQSGEDGGISFIDSLDVADISSFDSVFIATPAITHYDIVSSLIARGARKIYAEKPLAMTASEHERLKETGRDTLLCTGYILRQSPLVHHMLEYIGKIERNGYHLASSSVVYQKYLPACAEKRTMTDLGIYEEIVHVLDLLFNCLGLAKGSVSITGKRLEKDVLRPDRTVKADISYRIAIGGHDVPVDLHMSFKEREKKRLFSFCYEKEEAEPVRISLSFDNKDQKDRICVSAPGAGIIWSDDSPSLDKLPRQMEEVISYFRTGDLRNLCSVDESMLLAGLVAQVSD